MAVQSCSKLGRGIYSKMCARYEVGSGTGSGDQGGGGGGGGGDARLLEGPYRDPKIEKVGRTGKRGEEMEEEDEGQGGHDEKDGILEAEQIREAGEGGRKQRRRRRKSLDVRDDEIPSPPPPSEHEFCYHVHRWTHNWIQLDGHRVKIHRGAKHKDVKDLSSEDCHAECDRVFPGQDPDGTWGVCPWTQSMGTDRCQVSTIELGDV